MLRPLAVALALFLSSDAAAHAQGGARYLGPGETVPSACGGGGSLCPPPRELPTASELAGDTADWNATRASSGVDIVAWEYWWEHNRSRYVNPLVLQGAARAPLARSDVDARIVPALLAALERERDPDIVCATLIALAKLGRDADEGTAREIDERSRKLLRSPALAIANAAVLALGLLGRDGALAGLTEIARDGELGRALLEVESVPTQTRGIAVYALALLAERSKSTYVHESVRATLCAELDRPVDGIGEHHANCVVALGSMPLRWVAGESVVSVAVERLFALLADARAPLLARAQAPRALARLTSGAGESVRTRLANALLAPLAPERHEHAALREACALALGQVGSAEDLELDRAIRGGLARRVTADDDVQLRAFALIALAQCGGRVRGIAQAQGGVDEVRAVLAAEFERAEGRLSAWAALAIGVQENALRATGRATSAAQLTLLRREFATPSVPPQFDAVALALGIAGDSAVTPLVRRRFGELQAERGAVPGRLALALALLDDEDACPAVRAALEQNPYSVELHRDALVAAALLGGRTPSTFLTGALWRARGLTSRGAAVTALAVSPAEPPVSALLERLGGHDSWNDSSRASAAAALGIVGSGENVPWNATFALDFDYRVSTSVLRSEDGDGDGILELL